MKQLIITLTFGFIFIFPTFCAFAQPQLKTAIPDELHLLQNPYNPMNILIIPANIEGIVTQPGDLVMAFDRETCVGAAVIKDVGEVLNLVATSSDEVSKGYKAGQTIRLEYHSKFDNTIYELTPIKILMGSMNFEELGTLYADFKATELSVEENKNDTDITVYPNPVSQQLNIVLNISNPLILGKLQLKLIDIKGSVIISKEYASKQNVIILDVSGLMRGEYNLLLSNSNMRFTQKVIKK